MQTPTLNQHRDGLIGYDLGVIGECQYALTLAGGVPSDIFRRRAGDVGAYGGWRWECGAQHPARYPHIPEMVALITRIAALALPPRVGAAPQTLPDATARQGSDCSPRAATDFQET